MSGAGAKPKDDLNLPVRQVIGELQSALADHGAAVLEAPPGAGKSTVVPLELLDQAWLNASGARKILMLEPRRLAARAVAERMADLRGEAVGRSVGYRVRFESAISAETRIEVVTEGILTRRIQNDPELSDVGLVIFDEFHERNLHGDLALALVLESRAAFREDLRVLVMSATLGGTAERVAALLASNGPAESGNFAAPANSAVPVIRSAGRAYPVDVRQLADAAIPDGKLYPAAVATAIVPVIQSALNESVPAADAKSAKSNVASNAQGDLLVFLPGAGEIRRVAARLADLAASDANLHASEVSVLPLYGDLNRKEQQAALASDPRGRRKIILATPIAETSLTIPGVRIVVDSGLCRAPQYAAGTGLSRLVLMRISRAAADQRAGRAGRTGPGLALRLWSQHDHDRLAAELRPEILDTDLAPLLLELAAWGVPIQQGRGQPLPLALLDAPPPAHIQRALDLLLELGALSSPGISGTPNSLEATGESLSITALGRAMVALPVHPRLAAMLIAASETADASQLATQLAALLSERDPVRRDSPPNTAGNRSREAAGDILTRLELLQRFQSSGAGAIGYADGVDVGALGRIARVAEQLARIVPGSQATRGGASRSSGQRDISTQRTVARLLARAFPDRVALTRSGQAADSGEQSYLLAAGQGATLPARAPGTLAPAALIALDLHPPGGGSRGGEDQIRLYAPIGDLAALEQLCAAPPLRERTVSATAYRWDREGERVRAVLETRCGALVLNARELQTGAGGSELDLEAVRHTFIETGARDLLKRRGLAAFAANDDDAQACRALQSRVEFAREQSPGDVVIPGLAAGAGLPDWSDATLLADPSAWLGDALYGCLSLSAFRRENRLSDVLLARLPYAAQRWLAEAAPTHMEVPSGSRIRLEYSADEVVLPVKLQELFGLRETPRVLDGRVPVTLHLLSPARRPIQITRDLANFWANTYTEVRKELKGRYPRHPWPDDPFDPVHAVATRHTKKRAGGGRS